MSETGRDFWDGVVAMTPAAQKRHSAGAISHPFSPGAFDITLFVFCHNHEDTILGTLATLSEAMDVVGKTYEIVVIDDASTDRSAELVKGFMIEFAHVSVVLRMNMRAKGLAQNYVDAAFIGCGTYYRMVLADNAEPVETMVDVLRAVGDADIVVPYYVSKVPGTGYQRRVGRVYEWLLNMVGGQSVNHYGAAHVHLRYNVLRWRANTEGPSFQIDLLCRLMEQGFTLKQVPCRARPTREQMPGGAWVRFWSAVHVLIDLWFRRLSRG
ncbi:MAG: glycosyltransferase [Rickettsiales bacterium]|nr:glycosyltransferase [Rickettsiales bacterium]